MKIAIILGTRPEIIKMSPIIHQLERENKSFVLIHSNQHYSAEMDSVFFKELKLPLPDYNLEVHNMTHGASVGTMLIKLEAILLAEKPDWVLVEGDTNTVLAGALAASKLGISVGHIEAGLRSYDRTMPEEINRIVADHVSDALFCPTENQRKILINEGVEENKIVVTGNTIVDAVSINLELSKKEPFYSRYTEQFYYVLTLHRPSNVDIKETLQTLLSTLAALAKENDTVVFFPIHPRTKFKLSELHVSIDQSVIKLIDPLPYLEMLAILKNAKVIFTDSGGIQEEACILRVPCITLRNNTERPETIEVGANVLGGISEETIKAAFKKMSTSTKLWINPFGNGHAASKILAHLFSN